MKRPRPYIPLSVRCAVAFGQLRTEGIPIDMLAPTKGETQTSWLARLLACLAACLGDADGKLALDHNPALILRPFNERTGKYTPDANDAGSLLYRTTHAHHIKTNVRGDGAQRSDTSERMHLRRMAENRGERERKPKAKIQSRGFSKQHRPMQSRNTIGRTI